MATLKSNQWYGWYLRRVESGELELPPYEKNDDGTIKLYYGEVFCRHKDCSKGQHKYTATNNLRTHIKSHEIYVLSEDDKGGRVKQSTVDQAVGWYRDLFKGVKPSECSVSSSESNNEGTSTLPLLPKKKDGSVHVTNMRQKVVAMGFKVPCVPCGKRNDCCKDINQCEHFLRFDCGDLAPTSATQEQTGDGEESNAA